MFNPFKKSSDSSKKKALITGITGQDGSYLAELLLEKGYGVYGFMRRSAERTNWRIAHLLDRIEIIDGDLTDFGSMRRAVLKTMPDEIYNLAAQSHVGESFRTPISTLEITGRSVLYWLELIREINPKIKFYQASTSELFGGDPGTEPQNEETKMEPHSPYAIAKLTGYHFVKLYRKSYDMFACNGILFNHESPRRGEDFVTRKITLAVARIKKGKQDFLELGNMDAKRDWGFALDYVEGMWRMLQQEKADDFVLSTNETHTVREFVEKSFEAVGIRIKWEGEGVNEIGKDEESEKVLVKINPKYFRPAEVNLLLGDNKKAKEILGWEPKVSFEELAKMMIIADLEKVKKG